MMRWIAEENVPWSMLGRGSNLLAPSRGWDGVAVSLQGLFRTFEIRGREILAGGGSALPALAGAACSAGLSGMVFAAGIPGTVGGAVFMNAGAYGEDMGGLVTAVQAVFPGGEIQELSGGECRFGYRHSLFQDRPGAVCRVAMRLLPGNREELRRLAREILEKRRNSFPIKVPNAGSVFRRPDDGPPPGRLLEECGLKGRSAGGARFSPIHANFIENTGGADSDDVLALVRLAKKVVLERTGILLREEIRILGGGE
jgi:UDP-N-acetylmuramate dehydrogenase